MLLSKQLPTLPQDILASIIELFSKDGLTAFFLLLVGIISATGAGGLLLSFLDAKLDSAQRLLFSLALGIGVLSFLAFFIGIVGGYNQSGMTAGLIVVAVFFVAGIIMSVKTINAFEFKPTRLDLLFFAILCIVGMYLFSKALKPATFYDAITNHLGIPNFYLNEGGIKYISYDSYSNYPFMAEMLYTLGLFLSGLKLAQFTSVLMFIASTLAVYDLSRTRIPDMEPALPAVVFMLTPAFIEVSILYTNDLYLLFFIIMAVYSFVLWEINGSSGYLILLGIFVGICLGTKYTAYFFAAVPAFTAVIYVLYKEGAGLKKCFKTLSLLVIVVFLVDSPWLLKNFVNTGNPFYPALFNILGGKDMTSEVYDRTIALATHPGVSGILSGMFVHPWSMVMSNPGNITKTYGSSAFLGPVALLFLPLLLFMKDVPSLVKKMCVLAAVMYLLWLVSFNQTRYFYPAIAMLLVASSYAMTRVALGAPVFLRYLFVTVAAFYLLINLNIGFYQVDTWTSYGYQHLKETDEEFLNRRTKLASGRALAGVPVYNYINKNLGNDVRVLIIGDSQHLYINRRHLCVSFFSAATPYDIFRDSKGDHKNIAEFLKSQGISYIVYNPSELTRLQVMGNLNYGKEDNKYIAEFLGSRYAGLVTSSKNPATPVYLFKVL
jgi:hypothetical protein